MIKVRENILIAHSLPGEVFGPAQNMHGATYLVDAEFFTDKLMERENGMRVLTLMDIGIPLEALVKVITFSGFLEGKWTVDVAKMLDPLVAMLLTKIAKDAKLNNVRINIGDPNDKEFMESATMHEMAMKQDHLFL